VAGHEVKPQVGGLIKIGRSRKVRRDGKFSQTADKEPEGKMKLKNSYSEEMKIYMS